MSRSATAKADSKSRGVVLPVETLIQTGGYVSKKGGRVRLTAITTNGTHIPVQLDAQALRQARDIALIDLDKGVRALVKRKAIEGHVWGNLSPDAMFTVRSILTEAGLND